MTEPILTKTYVSSKLIKDDVNCGNTNEMKIWPSQLWSQFKQLQI